MTHPSIRQIQAITPNGVGAVFDVRGQSFVTAGIGLWPTTRMSEVHSSRLPRLLGVGRLLAPPCADDEAHSRYTSGPELPVVRFPQWLFCGSCRRMVQWRRADENVNPHVRCPRCSTSRNPRPLTPMRWVMICPQGHLDDVDWPWFTHVAEPGEPRTTCKVRDNLHFETVGHIEAGLGGLRVRCHTCGADRRLSDLPAFPARYGLGCRGRQPWEDVSSSSEAGCTETPVIAQRRAGNVYYAELRSALEVPSAEEPSAPTPEWMSESFFRGIVDQVTKVGLDALPAGALDAFASVLGTSTKSLREALSSVLGDTEVVGRVGLDAGEAAIAADEWRVLGGETPVRTADLVTTVYPFGGTAHHKALDGMVPQVTVVHALREVRAHLGFHRVAPRGEQSFVGVEGASWDHRTPDWLPAVEVRGEGLVVSLDTNRLSRWENLPDVATRIRLLDRRLQSSVIGRRLRRRTGPRLTPRYVLIHTLAHLMIRRLSFESGYGASSLRERIYARTDERGVPQYNGFLIYTAAGDAEGTLGGLARQGEPDRLVPTLLSALDDASWCSADPLCSEQTATSMDGLNLAACHACTLVSETSCECGNLLLDRCLVVGHGGVPGFFGSLSAVGDR